MNDDTKQILQDVQNDGIVYLLEEHDRLSRLKARIAHQIDVLELQMLASIIPEIADRSPNLYRKSLSELDMDLGSRECDESPLKRCVYDAERDPKHNCCLFCYESDMEE